MNFLYVISTNTEQCFNITFATKKAMKEQTKLILKEFIDGDVNIKEIYSLDEVKSCGNFIVVCKNATTANGLPQINGKNHNCYCCEAQLTVTGCYSENESQSDTAYGQSLTICDRETGTTSTYTRTISPTKNNGKWSLWQMVVTGDIALVSENKDIHEQFTTLNEKIETEYHRACEAENKLATKTNELANFLGFAADYSVSLTNGTQGNGGNSYAVRVWKKVPGEVGRTYYIITNRPPDEGCIYIYGIAVYHSLDGTIYQNYSRPLVEYDSKKTINYVTLQEGEVGFNFVIAQLNVSTGEYVPLRVTSFNGYDVKIKTFNKIDNIVDRLDALTAETPIFKRNSDRTITLAAMCRYRKNTTAPYKDYQLLVCTDSHDDKLSVSNSIDALNSFTTLDACVHCGDILGGHFEASGVQRFKDCIKLATKPVYAVVGNHDVGNTWYVAACATHMQTYDSFIKPMVDNGVLKSGEYQVGKPYWYHDDTTNKVRLIGLYEYDDPMDFDETYWKPIPYDATLPKITNGKSFVAGEKGNPIIWGYPLGYDYTAYSFECLKACTISGTTFHNCMAYLPKYKIQRGMRVIRQEQAQWFLDTLASVPAYYGVIVVMHNPFSDVATTIQSKFSQTAGVKASEFSQNLMRTDFIRNAVVAFIEGSKYSEEIVMKGEAAYLNSIPSADGSDYAYKVEKDFGTKNSNAHFLGFIGGHTHRDFVWKDASENIYQITPCCATTEIANATGCDIRRTNEDGPAKDSLTAVSFSSTRIALAKIGVNVTENGTVRDCEVIKL